MVARVPLHVIGAPRVRAEQQLEDRPVGHVAEEWARGRQSGADGQRRRTTASRATVEPEAPVAECLVKRRPRKPTCSIHLKSSKASEARRPPMFPVNHMCYP